MPGLVVIFLFFYWQKNGLKTISDHKDDLSGLGLSLFIFVAAWVIGTTLDVGVFIIFQKFFKKFANDHSEKIPKIWENMHLAKPWERGNIAKAAAQMKFFRNMASICAIVIFLCLLMEIHFLLTGYYRDSSFVSTIPASIMDFLLELKELLPILYDHNGFYAFSSIILGWVFYSIWKVQPGSLTAAIKIVKKRHPNSIDDES
ncbi:MAG: hypothetical protein WDM76_01325 [Limisphaerales bacterium]